MNKEKKVKVGIVLFFFLICIIIVAVVFTFRKEEMTPEESMPFNMQYVTEYSNFFSVVNNINQYITLNINRDSLSVYNLLHKEYLSSNNINENNVLNKVPLYKENSSFKAKKMYYEEHGDSILYYVEGDIIETLFEEINVVEENIAFFVVMDYKYVTFAIYPIINKVDAIPIQNKEANISINKNNEMRASGIVTDNYICNLYFSEYLNQLYTNLDSTYDLLDDEFKNRKYSYKERYVEDMKNKLSSISFNITSCSSSSKKNKRVYTIQDENKNTFTFTENSIMNYKVSFSIK